MLGTHTNFLWLLLGFDLSAYKKNEIKQKILYYNIKNIEYCI